VDDVTEGLRQEWQTGTPGDNPLAYNYTDNKIFQRRGVIEKEEASTGRKVSANDRQHTFSILVSWDCSALWRKSQLHDF
jgi:hypothetical protein